MAILSEGCKLSPGRIALVATGLYPTDSFKQTFAVVAGTTIAVIFAVYIRLKWKAFK